MPSSLLQTINTTANVISDRPRTPSQERIESLLSTSPSSSSSNEIIRSSTSSSASIHNVQDHQSGMQPRLRQLRTPISACKHLTKPLVTRQLSISNRRTVCLQYSSSTEEDLRDAINDESLFRPTGTISRPPLARLAPSSDMRNPQLLSSLARSTLPSARLTTPPPIHILNQDSDKPVITLEQSPPTRTSIESLRTLRDRGVGPQAPTPDSPRAEFSTSLLSKWWFLPESKATVDQLLKEEDRASTAEGERVKHLRKYLAPRNPVVFCHGLLGFDTVKVGPIYPMQVSHWRGIKEVLEANGVEVLFTRVPATSSIEERAKVLEKSISEAYSGRSVHLIGHSMGGLDCRYLATHIKTRMFKVLSVTTLATPHRGSAFADHFIETIGRERLPSVVSLLEFLPNGGGDGRAFESLTLDSMKKFNEATPNAEGVQYFSWGAEATPGLLDPFRWPHSVILEIEGPNDGLVSVDSAKWGTYLGTLRDVNHLDLIGWINTTKYKWAEWTGKEIKFKPATFYLGVTDHLAKTIEGQTRDGLENRVQSVDKMQSTFNDQGYSLPEAPSNSTEASPIEDASTIEANLDVVHDGEPEPAVSFENKAKVGEWEQTDKEETLNNERVTDGRTGLK